MSKAWILSSSRLILLLEEDSRDLHNYELDAVQLPRGDKNNTPSANM